MFVEQFQQGCKQHFLLLLIVGSSIVVPFLLSQKEEKKTRNTYHIDCYSVLTMRIIDIPETGSFWAMSVHLSEEHTPQGCVQDKKSKQVNVASVSPGLQKPGLSYLRCLR